MVKTFWISILLSQFCQGATLTPDNECKSTIRLDLPPGVIANAKIPVHDQADLNICAAMANSVLIDSWRFLNDPPIDDHTSPISLNWQYAAAKGYPKPEGLNGLRMLSESKNLYSCSQKRIGTKFNSLTPFQFVSQIHSSYANFSRGTINERSALDQINKCYENSGISNRLEIEKLREFLNSKSSIDFANKVLLDICADKKKELKKLPDPVSKKATEFGTNRDAAQDYFRKLLNERLSKPNSQPVGIHFCRKVFKNPEQSGILPDGSLNNQVGCEDDSHYSVVVGRRLLKYTEGNKTKTICQFLVRDSFGTSCNNYPDDPTTEPKTRCENGQIWVDENALTYNIGETYYLKDKSK